MSVLSFASAFRAPVKVERQCSYRLGENTHASPYGRKVQRTLLGDIHFTGGIGDRICRDNLVYGGLELGRGDVAPLFEPPERKPLHRICFVANLMKWLKTLIRLCLLIDI